MVALMRFARLCRLFGFGNGPAVQQEEQQMDCGAATIDPTDTSVSQDTITGEEGLSEEEKVKRRAERRRAKRKRRRERRKQEQVKQSESAEQEDEDEDGGGESDLEESESEAEVAGEEERNEPKEEESAEKPLTPHKCPPVPAMASSEMKEVHQPQDGPSEEEPEWDVSSAFFANAASHIKPKGSSRRSKENKENEARREMNGSDAVTKRSASLTEKGIKLVNEGQYALAVSMFTEAIRYDPKDYRFFGNRSYCYICLEQYPQALADAERSIQLAPDWPKGHFRKGSALMGMKRYSEAEKAMEQVLKLDKNCDEAVNELFNCRVLQLMEMGFEETQSIQLLEKFCTVQAVLASCPEACRVGSQEFSTANLGPCPSLWVGNVTTELTEKLLWDLFKTYGEIDSIRVLHERFCAFVNFKNADMAARAMDKLNGYSIENTRLVVRYPDRRTQKVLPVPQQAGATAARRSGPVNGDECYFWRTTGCHFGDKCRYKHIPDQKGKDRKPWQP
ncbi:uncharacterized protein zgc:123010 isoform X2 [Lampris incognitus]|uniref:uncharacterized protein zgc:123010 isoform X2 n=1 Tax=Lampris incognitus TaxID=2546036 RepID=UPI0024B56C93|nr:uncharacterized protein zgc:123010 isoform X2 [Lampris incognitus]